MEQLSYTKTKRDLSLYIEHPEYTHALNPNKTKPHGTSRGTKFLLINI
jgi:hypothetical protein